jgi:hypothetical protein
LDFLGALLLSNSPQNVGPKVRGDEEEEEEESTRISRHTTHKRRRSLVVRIINRGNQSD